MADMPMRMPMPMSPEMMGGDDGPDEEKSEGDAIQSAFDAIRAAIDDAERELVMGRAEQPEEPSDEEPAAPSPGGK